MPEVDVRPGVRIAYEDDWFGPAWEEPQTILFVHGVAESSKAWQQWVPVLSGRFRLIRMDVPGFGRSTAPQDYDWHWKTVAGDIAVFLDKIGIRRTHIVAAKYGGCLAMGFAISCPDRVITLGVFGSPGAIPHLHKLKTSDNPLTMIKTLGVHGWAAKTMRTRLGRSASEEQVKWWADELMGKADPRAVYGASAALAELDFEGGLSRITAPTLVVTTTESGLQDVAGASAYQRQIPRSDLQVINDNCYHVSVVRPVDCAQRMLAFIDSHPN